MAFDPPLLVTRPTLPDFDRFVEGLATIWDTRWLSNFGPVHKALEDDLRIALAVPNVAVFANGTLALEAALSALDLTGEVITTPFTYVATANAIRRCGLEPIFADVDPYTMTIDPNAVADLVTDRTSAILGVHVFGQVCDHPSLEALAHRHGLALIYDAAHAFDTTIDGKPVGKLGDVSMFSLHATKPVQGVEGGVLSFTDPLLAERLHRFANHGLAPSNDTVEGIATNAKMSELHALMCTLALKERQTIANRLDALEGVYREALLKIPGVRPAIQKQSGVDGYLAFFPLMVEPTTAGLTRDSLHQHLQRHGVYSRKYFAPLIPTMPAFQHAHCGALDEATRLSERVLALPFYADLDHQDARTVVELIACCPRER